MFIEISTMFVGDNSAVPGPMTSNILLHTMRRLIYKASKKNIIAEMDMAFLRPIARETLNIIISFLQ